MGRRAAGPTAEKLAIWRPASPLFEPRDPIQPCADRTRGDDACTRVTPPWLAALAARRGGIGAALRLHDTYPPRLTRRPPSPARGRNGSRRCSCLDRVAGGQVALSSTRLASPK